MFERNSWIRQLQWNENQAVLAAAMEIPPDRTRGALEPAAAGSWSLGTVDQPSAGLLLTAERWIEGM